MIPSRPRLRFLGAVASLLALASCIDYQENLVLEDNLSGRLSATISMNQMLAGAATTDEDGSPRFSAERLKEDAAKIQGLTVESAEEFTESGKRHLRYTLSFDSIKNLSLPPDPDTDPETTATGDDETDFRNFVGQIEIEKKDGNLIIQRTVVFEKPGRKQRGEETKDADGFAKAMLQGLFGGSQFTYETRFPSVVVAANSSAIDNATNTVVWKFDLAQLAAEPALMRAEILRPAHGLDIFVWVLIAVIAIIAIAVIGAGLLFITLRSRQSSAASTSR